MAPRLRTEAVVEQDLQEYLNGYSDFSFEIRALKMLRDHRIDCEHGGYYEDPVTGKPRQFDIRARVKNAADKRVLRMAVECKNLRENFPLLVSCVPRQADEALKDARAVALNSEAKVT